MFKLVDLCLHLVTLAEHVLHAALRPLLLLCVYGRLQQTVKVHISISERVDAVLFTGKKKVMYESMLKESGCIYCR